MRSALERRWFTFLQDLGRTMGRSRMRPSRVSRSSEMCPCWWMPRLQNLTVPNVHLQRGATLVGYSGGKALRGPQSAGILLGRKDLVQAAWSTALPITAMAVR